MLLGRKLFIGVMVLIICTTVGIIASSFFYSAKTISQLFNQNEKLQTALNTLQAEEQIGFLKVISVTDTEKGKVTTIEFTQNSPQSKNEIVSKHVYSFLGDILYIDAMIVKFSPELVADGKERAIYLLRRFFSEYEPPSRGTAIERFGSTPDRYQSLLDSFSLSNKTLFWENIWDLANDPAKLESFGIQAIYGNALYIKVEAQKLYYLKINPSGQIFPEVVNI